MRSELKEVENLLREIDVYEHYKSSLVASVKKLDVDYQAKRFGYVEYENRLNGLLKGKSRQEWVLYYNSYIYSLLKRIEYFLSKLFYSVYEGAAEKPVPEASKAAVPVERKTEEIFEEKVVRLKEKLEEPLAARAVGAGELRPVEPFTAKMPSVPTVEELNVPEVKVEIPARPSVAAKIPFKAVKLPAFKFKLPRLQLPRMTLPGLAVKEHFAVFSRLPKISGLFRKAGEKPKREGFFDRLFSHFKPEHRPVFIEEIVKMEKTAKPFPEEKPIGKGVGITFAAVPGKKLVADILARFKAKQEPVIGEKIEIPVQIRKIREMRKKIYESERLAGFDTTLLAQEAKRIRRILEVEKPEVYKGSSIGLIANVSVKKISLYFVDTFPEIFGFLYNALRAANVKLLSNTYVNIMILCTILMSIFTSFFTFVLFFLLNHPLYEAVLRSVLFGFFAGGLCATFFYAYPFLKIKERRRSILTNLPFAINHIASVSASGVPPAKMFELISTSDEYGEIAVEIRKIVDFINVFGYDLLTAIRSVSSTTPSSIFKEFLEGFTSIIETGGDLSSYLRQKADEAALNYELERRKYNETVSTYSDIYTGIVIAAPLLFMSALSLVNLLGGTLGGMGVDVVMALSAYLVIPLLNIGFLMFLQMNQPEA